MDVRIDQLRLQVSGMNAGRGAPVRPPGRGAPRRAARWPRRRPPASARLASLRVSVARAGRRPAADVLAAAAAAEIARALRAEATR